MAIPGLRDLYNAFEQVATPIATGITNHPEFAKVAAAVTTVNKALRAEADKVQARAWHALNLPAGTDVQRLRIQVGALDREVRLLTLELERARQQARQQSRQQSRQQTGEVNRRGTPGPEHD